MKKIAGILIILVAILAAGIIFFGAVDLKGTGEKTTENKQEVEKDDSKKDEDECEAGRKPVTINVGSLKGPTSMGLVSLMKESESQSEKDSVNYEFTMETDASVLLPKMIKGELDIALLPANVAATLYQKMEGKLQVIDINTLGVLYMVSADSSINEMSKLKGKTIYLTGKGTTPDYVLQYLLKENGITDVTLEYKSCHRGCGNSCSRAGEHRGSPTAICDSGMYTE